MRALGRVAPPARKTYHHGNLKPVLIQAGLELIAEKGVRALTLREIGARAGVSRSAAYRHFTDKADLLEAICEAGFELFANALEHGRDEAGSDFLARFNGMGSAYVRFARQYPSYFEVMFTPTPDGAPRTKSAPEERSFCILLELIQEGQKLGHVQPGDPMMAACAVWSLVHGVSVLRLEESGMIEGVSADQIAIAFSNLLLNGIGKR
jgi:AcrR family transcriptional regulator